MIFRYYHSSSFLSSKFNLINNKVKNIEEERKQTITVNQNETDGMEVGNKERK